MWKKSHSELKMSSWAAVKPAPGLTLGGFLNQCLTTTNGPRTYLSERSCRSPTTTLRLQIAVVWQTFRKWSSYYLGYEAHFVNIPSPQDLLPNDMQLFMIHQCTHRTLKMVSKGKPSTSVHAFVQGVLAWVCTWSIQHWMDVSSAHPVRP